MTGDGQSVRRLGDALRAGGPVADLLVHGRRVPADCVAPELIDTLLALEWVRVDDHVLDPTVRVDSWNGLVLAHDPSQPDRIERESVLGVNNTTRSLASLTPRHPVRRALDLATGPGSLALLLARHADQVVATDVSERACRFARANADLNGVEIDVRRGDLYGPVPAGDFDLVSANLPFVVSPDTDYTFRDGGRDRDHLSRDAVRGAATRLAPDGIAVLMCNWVIAADDDAALIPLAWVDDEAVSVIVVRHSVEDPAEYASRWNSFLLRHDPAAYAATLERWAAAFTAWDVTGIANGAVVLHRPIAGAAVRASMTMAHAPAGDGGAQIARIVRNRTWLARCADDDLLTATPALVPPHRLEQVMRYDGTWSAASSTMRLDDTAGVIGTVEPLATHTVLRIDGVTPIAALVEQAADATGLDQTALTASTLTAIRNLLAHGCLDLVGSE